MTLQKSNIQHASDYPKYVSDSQENHSKIVEQKSGDPLILGTIANNLSPTPEILPSAKIILPSNVIREKLELQSESAHLLGGEKVSQCLRGIIPTHNTVEIHYEPKTHTAHYKNLITCGRVWQCPVCASKITEQRAAELLQAVTAWHDNSGFCVMSTHTLQHKVTDPLTLLLEAVVSSHTKMVSGKSYQLFKTKFGVHGYVRALEPTVGVSGWHPHNHILWFLEPMGHDLLDAFKHELKLRWARQVESSGRYASYQHGTDVRIAQADVYDYVAKFGRLPMESKWTVEREMAKAPTKKAHADGKTPFQLLRDSINGDKNAGRLFVEYAHAFKGRKQLSWSVGLRAALGLGNESSDEEIAALLPVELVLMVTLTRANWKALLALPRDVRGDVLAIAALGNKTRLVEFLEACGVKIEGV